MDKTILQAWKLLFVIGFCLLGSASHEPIHAARRKHKQASQRQIQRWIKGLRSRYAGVRKRSAEKLGKAKATGAIFALLIRLKEDNNRYVKRAAAWALGQMGTAAKNAVPSLTQEIGISPGRRQRAIGVLGRIGPPAHTAVPTLLRHIRAVGWKEQQQIIWAIGRIGPQATKALPQLRIFASHTRASIRKTAIWAIGRLGPRAQSAERTLRHGLRDKRRDIRAIAAFSLGQLPRISPESEAALSQAASGRNTNLRRNAAYALGRTQSHSKTAILALLKASRWRDRETRQQVTKAFATLQRKALPGLLHASKSRDHKLRAASATYLGTLAKNTPDARIALLALTADSHPFVRRQSIKQLDTLPMQSVIQVITKIETPSKALLSFLISKLKKATNPARNKIIWALGKLGPSVSADVSRPLLPFLRHRSWKTRSATVWAFGQLKSSEQGVCRGLAKRLLDDHRKVRHAAAWTLEKLGPAASCAVTALIRSSKSPSVRMRLMAVRALGHIGPPAARALPALKRRMRDRIRTIREAALFSLGQIGPAAFSTLRRIYQRANWRKRRAIIASFTRTTPNQSHIFSLVQLGLKDKHTQVRLAALKSTLHLTKYTMQLWPSIQHMIQSNTPIATTAIRIALQLPIPPNKRNPVLERAFQGTNWTIRRAVVQAIYEQPTLQPYHVAILQQAIEDQNPKMKSFAIWIAGKRKIHARPILRLLQKGCQDKEQKTKLSSLWALAKIGPKAVRALPGIRLAMFDSDPKVRQTAAWAAGHFGKTARPLLPRLRHLLRDAHPPTRQSAKRSIDRINRAKR